MLKTSILKDSRCFKSMFKLILFEHKLDKSKIFLMPENYRWKEGYNPIYYINKVLGKESKDFIYKGGYRKPKENKEFKNRELNLSESLMNVYILVIKRIKFIE